MRWGDNTPGQFRPERMGGKYPRGSVYVRLKPPLNSRTHLGMIGLSHSTLCCRSMAHTSRLLMPTAAVVLHR